MLVAAPLIRPPATFSPRSAKGEGTSRLHFLKPSKLAVTMWNGGESGSAHVHGLSAEILRGTGAAGKPVAAGVPPAVEGARPAAWHGLGSSYGSARAHAPSAGQDARLYVKRDA